MPVPLLQGFYRQEDYESENPATPQFFANGVEQAVPVLTGSVNSMTEAAQSFSAGNYTIDPIEFTVGDDGQIVLGISGTATKQWVCFDNFRLTYLGASTITDITSVKSGSEAGVLYDLTGRRVMQPTKGLFIRDGKKVVVK